MEWLKQCPWCLPLKVASWLAYTSPQRQWTDIVGTHPGVFAFAAQHLNPSACFYFNCTVQSYRLVMSSFPTKQYLVFCLWIFQKPQQSSQKALSENLKRWVNDLGNFQVIGIEAMANSFSMKKCRSIFYDFQRFHLNWTSVTAVRPWKHIRS